MKTLNTIKDYVIITLADIWIASAIFFFLVPSQTAVGGITGLSIVISNFLPLSVSVINFIINLALLIVGFMICGKEFGVKTVYTSLMIPAILSVYEYFLPNNRSLTGNQFTDIILYCFFVSIPVAKLFNMNASSGGLDIVAKILNKLLHMDIGRALSISGVCVAASAIFAYDLNTVVISIFGTYLNGVVVDHFIFGGKEKKRVCIISKKEEEIRNFILHELHSGATIYEAHGAYDNSLRREIITIVDKQEYAKLMTYISGTDDKAFITVYAVNEVMYTPKLKK